MEQIKELLALDYTALILGIFVLMSGFIAIYNIVGKFSEIIGKPLKWVKKKNADHDILMAHEKAIENLAKQHADDTNKIYGEENTIKADITKLTNMFLDREIDTMRWDIISFSSSLSNGKKFNREGYNHIFSVYDKYEAILEENNMENGLIEESIAYIKEVYREGLKNGTIK